MLFTYTRRAIADRVVPRSRAWRTPEDIEIGPVAAALGLGLGEVAGLDVVEVDHGTSLRSILRLRHTDGSETSLFAKNTPVTFGPGALDALALLCEREARFYTDMAPQIPTAPRALVARWDPRTGRSTVVMADLGAEGFVFRPISEPCSVAEAGLVVDALADLHAAAGAAPHPDEVDPLYALDGKRARGMTRLVCRTLGRRPKSLLGRVPEQILEDSRILADRPGRYADVLAGFPQAFLHNDTHRGNVGIAADRAVLIDWQNCGWGPALKDVAYFLGTSLDPADRRQHERDLLQRYLARVREAGGTVPDGEDAWFGYRVLMVTAYVAAAVTAMFGARLQAAANAEEGLNRACAAVADLDSFAALRERMDRAPRSFPGAS